MKIKMKLLPIPSYSGYFAGEDGNIYSNRNFNRYHNTNQSIKMLNPHDNGSGHLGVTICINSKRKYRKIHRLVFEAFNGYCGEHIHHIDGNPTNNKPDNLISLDADDHYELHKFQTKEESCIYYLQSLGYKVIPPG
jgi:hypothetical protein